MGYLRCVWRHNVDTSGKDVLEKFPAVSRDDLGVNSSGLSLGNVFPVDRGSSFENHRTYDVYITCGRGSLIATNSVTSRNEASLHY